MHAAMQRGVILGLPKHENRWRPELRRGPLGELTALPQTLSLVLTGPLLRGGEEKGKARKMMGGEEDWGGKRRQSIVLQLDADNPSAATEPIAIVRNALHAFCLECPMGYKTNKKPTSW